MEIKNIQYGQQCHICIQNYSMNQIQRNYFRKIFQQKYLANEKEFLVESSKEVSGEQNTRDKAGR